MKKITENKLEVTMPFYEIRLSITGACNQNCVYCGPFTDGKYNKGYANPSLLQIKKIALELGGIIKKLKLHIQLTGGEPTLRKDLPEIVEILKGQGINDIGITTNGSMVTPDLCLSLIKKGLADFHFHLPSLDLAAYMQTVRKTLDDKRIKNILDSAKAIKKNGARVEFNTPVTHINAATLYKLFDFCYKNKINLKLIEELGVGRSRISFKEIKGMLVAWMSKKKIDIKEVKLEKRFGSIYQFNKKFFFRIAPVSSEFQSNLLGKNKKLLLDGRYWLGGREGKFLFTPSYFLDPKLGTIKEVKEQIIKISQDYKRLFNKI